METSWMRLKFPALLGCQLREKGPSATNPVYFVPVCGGEHLACHQMPLNGCFSKQKAKKWPPLPCAPLLAPHFLLDKHIESLSSFIYLSRAWFLSDPVAMVRASVWGRTCVYILWDAEKSEGGGECWCPLVADSSVQDLCCFNVRQLWALSRGP